MTSTTRVQADGHAMALQKAPLSAFEEQALELSKELLRLVCTGDLLRDSSLLSDSVSLLLPSFESFAYGKAEVSQQLAQLHEQLAPGLRVRSRKLTVEGLGETSCSITAQLFIRSNVGTALSRRMQALCSVVWTAGKDGSPLLRLCHCTLQEAASAKEPSSAARQDDEEASERHPWLDAPNYRIALHARGSDGITHWVWSRNVMYVAAAHQYTDIHCRDRLIRLRTTFTHVLAQLGECVMRVHRSYAVNPLYISHLQGTALHLITGTQLPIPIKKVSQVRLALQERSLQVGDRS